MIVQFFDHVQAEVIGAGYRRHFFHPERSQTFETWRKTHSGAGLQPRFGKKGLFTVEFSMELILDSVPYKH